MAQKISAVKIKYRNGTYSSEIPLYIDSSKVIYDNGSPLESIFGILNETTSVAKQLNDLTQQINIIKNNMCAYAVVLNESQFNDADNPLNTNVVYICKDPNAVTYSTNHWYSWNGSQWLDGGIFGNALIETNKTLRAPGIAADAASAGDAIAEITQYTIKQLAKQYETTKTYNSGDYALYENNVTHELELYRCNDTTTSTWNASKWDKVTIFDQFVRDHNSLRRQIAEIVNGTSDFKESATFTSNTQNIIPLLQVKIDPARGRSGDPSPDNVQPISGFTGARVVRCGRNLSVLRNDTNQDAWKFTYSLQDGGNITCVKNAAENRFFAKYLFPAVKGTAYRFKFDSFTLNGADSHIPTYLYRDALWGEQLGYFIIPLSGEATWTATESGLIVLGLYASSQWFGEGAQLAMNGFRVGLAAEEDKGYEASVWDTVDVAFPSEAGTVGAGTLDLTAGVLTVTHLFKQLDGTETWTLAGEDGTPYFSTPFGATLKNAASGWCSHFKWARVRKTTSSIGVDVFNSTIVARPPADIAQTVDDWKAWLAGQANNNTPVQVVCPLIEPQTYVLTPIQIMTLIGNNTIFADCGPVKTISTKININTIIKQGNNVFKSIVSNSDINTMIADKNYSKDNYLIINNIVYKVIADSLLQGADIIVEGNNANVSKTNICEELTYLFNTLGV